MHPKPKRLSAFATTTNACAYSERKAVRERLTNRTQPSYVDWAEQWGEWIIVTGGVGYRHFFDCKAEAKEYLRLTMGHGDNAYVWRTLDLWFKSHKHDFECAPHWQRGTDENGN